MTNNRIRLERKNKIVVVFMDRPEKNNAFDMSMFESLEQVTRELERDRPRAVVLTGNGDRVFSVGFDISLENPMTTEFLDVVNKKDTALAGKLINRVSDKGRCLDDAMNLAEQISRNGPKAINQALAVLLQSRDLLLKEALAKVAESAAKLIVSGECIHGITAFMEKKAPRFPD
jgi:enoyl-CoA hydratase/carnithine racemase